jgi:MFS transporter, ACS family, hexuronate transporter
MRFKYRWIIVAMLFLANVVNYCDRSAMSIALPILSKNFELTPAQSGMILSSFFIGYALFNFIGGYLADLKGPKKVMGYTMGIWSVFCGLTAGAYSFTSLFFVRLFFGFGEGPMGTTSNKVLNNWIPVSERARALGISNMGAPLGGAMAAPVVAFLSIYWGWQYSFICMAILGVAWALLWSKLGADKPEDNPKVSQSEIEEIRVGRINISQQGMEPKPDGGKIALFSIIRQRSILALISGQFGANCILWLFLTWFPSYLVEVRHLSIAEVGIVGILPWLVGAIGQFSGGFLVDFIYKKTKKVLYSRKIVIVSCLMGSGICMGFLSLVDSITAAVMLMTVGIGCIYLHNALYWAIIQDVVPSERVGGVGGFVHAISNTAGVLIPAITGVIIEVTGTYTGGFLLAGCLAIIGAFAVAFFVKSVTITYEKKVKTVMPKEA